MFVWDYDAAIFLLDKKVIWRDAHFPVKTHNMIRCRRREQMVQSHLNESFGSYHSTNSKQFQLSNESGNSACMNGIHPTYFQDSDIYGLFRKPRKESPVFWQKRLLWHGFLSSGSESEFWALKSVESSCHFHSRIARLKMRSRSIITVASAVLLGMGVLSFAAWRKRLRGWLPM